MAGQPETNDPERPEFDPADGARADEEEQTVMSMVWKSQVLGFAFMQGDELRFAQVADTSPEYRMLQLSKYTLKPDVLVVPTSADVNWLKALKTPCLLSPDADEGATGARDDVALDGEDAGESDEQSKNGPRIVRCKNRDFSAEAASKRLCLLRTLDGLPSRELTEGEVLMHLEHQLPREQEQALRAISGLLAYMQKSSFALVVSGLRRYALESQLYMSPDTFSCLHIFADECHPSVHGGRAREGPSIWTVMNRTRTKPGERQLRSWFARPTQDLKTLRERHTAIEFLSSPQNAHVVDQLHAFVGKLKDVTRLESSASQGGLLLSDYSSVLSTSSYAVKVRELLVSAGVPTELPSVSRALSLIDRKLCNVANTIADVIDFPASKRASGLSIGAAHICVRDGVDDDLDRLRDEYAGIEPLLDSVALNEQQTLHQQALLPSYGDLYVVYVPQLGFLLKLPMADADLADSERKDAIVSAYANAGLAYQFDADADMYVKSEACTALDQQYGDIGSDVKDLEARKVHDLEQFVLEWLPVLRRAQAALTELDCLLSLASAARDLQLTKPTVAEDGGVISIKGGWHPLLGALSATASLVPNDCDVGTPSQRLLLLTGPNGSGKTVYLRTVALIVYLAHIGSFVPAEDARVARTDAIHTRMHSKESASLSQSAFMLDLSQMANIFRHSTSHSLCLVDEFGKGTNAQDGISLLYASLTDLLKRGAACPRVLACTHYTELLEVPGFREQPGIALWTMQVLLKDRQPHGERHGERATAHETDAATDMEPTGDATNGEAGAATPNLVLDDEVVFLYKAAPGESTDSFGLDCALAANIPMSVIKRAKEISHCRAEGIPIERVDRDSEEALSRERALAELVDNFLAFDLGRPGSARLFFAENDAVLDRCISNHVAAN